MRAEFWAWWTRTWERLIALLAGLSLVTVHLIRNDAASLGAGVFLITLGLFIDRLEELRIGTLIAKFIQTQQEREAARPAMDHPAGGASASVPLAERNVELRIRRATPPRSLASSSGEAGWLSLGEVAGARTTDELVKALANYAQPARRLSADRLAAEREAMAAILDLQAERASAGYLGENTPDEQEAADEIEVFWSHPEDLTDEEVRHLAALMRRLIARDLEVGISRRISPSPSGI